MQKRDIITHNGVRFIRYPESHHMSDRRYYKAWYTIDGARIKAYLHRVLWMEANGPIPGTHHIHHEDGNTLNNSLENLTCIPGSEHLAGHWTDSSEEFKRGRTHTLTTVAQEAAKPWHASDEGRAWHGQNAKKYWAKREPTTQVCTMCGKGYQTKDLRFDKLKFCSKACLSAERRRSGVDNEMRQCPVCQVEFAVNKYSVKKTCSRACGGALGAKTRAT